MKTHYLKTWPEYFEAVRKGVKTFEARKFDRNYAVQDIVVLQEYTTLNGYTGREIQMQITYILSGGNFGIEDGYCIFSMQPYKIED
jgi:hypothetical protein